MRMDATTLAFRLKGMIQQETSDELRYDGPWLEAPSPRRVSTVQEEKVTGVIIAGCGGNVNTLS